MSSFPKTTPVRVFLTVVARKVPRTPASRRPENSRSARRRRVDNLLPLKGVTAAAIAANSSILFFFRPPPKKTKTRRKSRRSPARSPAPLWTMGAARRGDAFVRDRSHRGHYLLLMQSPAGATHGYLSVRRDKSRKARFLKRMK